MLSPQDIDSFFIDRSRFSPEDYILLKYRFETDLDPRLVAAALCSEQSTAQWKRPGVEEDFRPLFAAKVISLKNIRPNFYEIEIAHPHRNFGARIPNFLSAAAGEGAFYCPGIRSIKWLDFTFPKSLLDQFEGPQFGINGLRKILGVEDRPIFIGVVKPNIGLDPKDFAEFAYQSWMGGLDIAKDDEMLADTPDSPLGQRARLASEAKKRAEKQTGQKKIFLSNITDEVDQMLSLYDQAIENGADMVMINGIMAGVSAIRMIRKKSTVPIVGHFTGVATFSRIPDFGIASTVFTKLQRLAGADLIIIAGFGERMHSSDEEVLENIRAALEPMENIKPSLPVPGGSDWAGTLPKVYEKIKNKDFGFIAGRGVFGHPDGPAAGATSLHEAWEAIQNGISLEEFAKNNHPSLKKALETFGK